MKVKYLLVLCAGLMWFFGPAISHAQSIKSYLNDNANSVWRVELVAPAFTPAIPTSIWEKLGKWLGIRQVTRIKPPVGTVLLVQASAYAPSPYQTDATPCVTASGTRVRPGVVASNFLAMGTILEIQGEKFIVEDRMNARYAGYFMDIWFPSTSKALEFGRQKLNIKVVGYGEPGQDVRGEKQTDTATSANSQTQDPGFWSRLKNNIVSVGEFITAKVSSDANKHDVNCDQNEEG